MSTRQIRRLQRELEKKDEEDAPPPSKCVITVNRPAFSFSAYRHALDSSDESEQESSSSSDSDSSASESESSSSESEESATEAVPSVAAPARKHGRKAKKAPSAAPVNDGGTDSDSDLALLDAGLEQRPQAPEDTKEDAKNRFECLRIEPRAFRVSGVDPRPSGKARVAKGFGGYLQGRNWLMPGVAPKMADKLRSAVVQHVRIKGNLDAKSGRERFSVELSDKHKSVQTFCLAAIDMQDPTLFRRVFEANPHHIEVLLRASAIHTLQGQHEEAFRLLSFALQLLQAALPPRFSPFRLDENGFYNTWLPSSVESNRMVYRLLVLYMISLERQGQWEACLAVCKLLLLMDFPNDIAHALLHIDLYILNNAGINLYEFSVGYAKALRYSVPLHWVLPNFAFSMALEYFAKEKSDFISTPISDDDLDKVQKFLLLREDKLGFNFQPAEQETQEFGGKRAQLFLLRALLQYPDILRLLSRESFASELVEFTDTEPFVDWTSSYDETDDVQLLKCYLAKTCDIWRNSNMDFLRKTAELVVDVCRSERGSLIVESFRDLWSAFRLEQALPLQAGEVIVAELDVTSHSLPTALE
ncbi:transcriptional repressor TCF25 [Babesia caballi]|uniref:Transcriptional repressor TCF25 n=1 Tax=Babesia caballi TaxID=5871 RepID=A0AAV4LUX9_BABCB|nr:transcriptional repressor TCF25 [Babesia caballi]